MEERSGNCFIRSGSANLALGILVGFVASCDAGESRRDEPVLRDSVGITIAENPGPGAPAPIWTLGDRPLLTVGRPGGGQKNPLFRVVGAARLDDGRIVVANAGTHEVLFFGPDGALMQTAGGEGRGPGEYLALGSLLAIPGDTLILYDPQLRRLTWLGPGGGLVRTGKVLTETLPDAEEDLSLAFMRLAGYMDHGLVFAAPPIRFTLMTNAGRLVSDTFQVLLTEPDGTRPRQIAAIPGTETWFGSYDAGTGRRIVDMPVPFGAAVHHASGGGRFFLGRSDRYEITVYEDSGAAALLIRRASTRRPVTAADREAFEDDFLPGAGELRQRLLDEIPIGTLHPEFAGLVATRHGGLWVRESGSPGADTTTWAIYGPEGLLKGRGRTPVDLVIQEIGVDYLLGLRRDDLDVERLELWALRSTNRDR